VTVEKFKVQIAMIQQTSKSFAAWSAWYTRDLVGGMLAGLGSGFMLGYSYADHLNSTVVGLVGMVLCTSAGYIMAKPRPVTKNNPPSAH
jgi:predicted lipid-binding transport protein (Tim44 family)